MLFLTCSVDVDPCPVANQDWTSPLAVMDLTQLGINPADILYAIGWGFGVVLLGFLIGYGVGVALGLIEQV